MKRIHNTWLALTAAFFFAIAGAACDDTARGVQEDTGEMTDEAREEADEAAEEGREAVPDAQRTAGEAGAGVDAVMETMDVKTALMTDDSIDASDINVDTYHETKTVVLKGSVLSEAQKTEAARIASREAPGYRIDNQLTVRPRE